jgi:hypothetical protein
MMALSYCLRGILGEAFGTIGIYMKVFKLNWLYIGF